MEQIEKRRVFAYTQVIASLVGAELITPLPKSAGAVAMEAQVGLTTVLTASETDVGSIGSGVARSSGLVPLGELVLGEAVTGLPLSAYAALEAIYFGKQNMDGSLSNEAAYADGKA